jgi:hypothetical protein
MLISTHLAGTARPLPRVAQLNAAIERHLEIVKLRYMDMEFHTGGPIAFMTHLLMQILDPGVLKRDMLDVHVGTVMEMIPQVARIFDTVESGVKHKRNTFIKGKTKEIYISTMGVVGNQVTVLDDWTAWKKIQPVKLVASDTKELKLYWYHQPKFTLSKPHYAVFAIDVEALLLKYILYLRQHDIGLENPNIHEFINREIIPFFYEDLAEIWMSQLLRTISNGDTPEMLSSDLFASSRFTGAVEETRTFYDKLIRGNYRVGDFFKTGFFLKGRSLVDRVHLLEKVYGTNMSVRHRGYSLLKMADPTHILINALSDTREQGLETSMIRKLQYDMRLLSRSGWANHVKDHTAVATIAGLLEHASTLDR